MENSQYHEKRNVSPGCIVGAARLAYRGSIKCLNETVTGNSAMKHCLRFAIVSQVDRSLEIRRVG